MKNSIFAALLPLLIILPASCSRTKPLPEELPDSGSSSDNHAWYAFNDGSFVQVSRPQDAPSFPEKPWTEAVRISSASCAEGDGETMPAAYAVVNRRGILVFKGNSFELYKDEKLFTDRTAGNLVFQNDTPLFSLYKSAFFNTTLDVSAPQDELHPFLALFDPASDVSYPVISCQNLGLDAASEVTDFIWDGNVFICSVKTQKQKKTVFSYISAQAKVPLLSLTPANASSSLLLSATDKDAFRSQKTPKPFGAAPDRVKKLLVNLPADTPCYITCFTAGGHSPRIYLRQKLEDETVPMNVQAVLADTWAAAMFCDGTTYISGSLFDRHLMKNGKTCAFLLPKLPEGYEYTSFAVSGTTMYASWEETDFYKTGRSGFLSVDLDKILYGARSGDIE